MRKSWDEYFMEIAKLVSTRSTCRRRQVGAVLVKDNQILATGYNGSPKGFPHCLDAGCLREERHIPSGQNHELCVAVHAEQNAIAQAASRGVAVNGSTIYTLTYPCVICTKILINAGIKRIVYINDYEDELAKKLLAQTDIEVVKYSK